MMTFKQFIEEGSLEMLPFELALRKEYHMDRQQAEKTISWLRNETSWEDLGLEDFFIEAVGIIWSSSSDFGQPYERFVRDEITSTLLRKYKLKLGDISK